LQEQEEEKRFDEASFYERKPKKVSSEAAYAIISPKLIEKTPSDQIKYE
jgi:hypothetical protein